MFTPNSITTDSAKGTRWGMRLQYILKAICPGRCHGPVGQAEASLIAVYVLPFQLAAPTLSSEMPEFNTLSVFERPER
jgi:hypothetical protein